MSGRTLREITIFLASPGDVSDERARVRIVAEEINRGLGEHHGFVLRIVGWDTDARPEFGGDPQSLLNEQIAQMEKYDFFVGIMWNRFGERTPRAESGTKEEFERAVESLRAHGRPEILLYFGQKPFNPRSGADIEQKGKVLTFKEGLRNQGVYWEYQGVEEFEKLFRKHLQDHLMSRLPQIPPPVPVEVMPARDPVPPPGSESASGVAPSKAGSTPPILATVDNSGAWVLLGDEFFESESVTDKGDGTVVLEIVPTSPEQRAALSALRRTGPAWSPNEPRAYAHGDDAGLARVQDAESRSVAGKIVWTVTLKVDQDLQGNTLANMGINNLSAEEVATIRARFLLLDERPPDSDTRGSSAGMGSWIITSALKAKAGIFPAFWQRFQSRPDLFMPLARLWAIYHLKINQICEHVLELRLGPLEVNRLVGVAFRGRRRKRYVNEPAAEISVEGRCRLTATGLAPIE